MNNDKPFHIPVLVKEVLHYLNIGTGKIFLDVTFGGGGHTKAILEQDPTCTVIALDWDQHTLETNGVRLQQQFPGRLHLIWGNFAHLYKLLHKEGIEKVDGIIADFGTSQFQLTQAHGFSFHHDTPLDMRMSPAHQKMTAAEIVNKGSEEKLRELFWQLGEEKNAKLIVRAIVAERKKKEIKTTRDLAQIIEKMAPRLQRIHPATRVFQALRIYINSELENIEIFLPAALSHTVQGARVVVITFHSLEDRIVKQFFNKAAEEKKSQF